MQEQFPMLIRILTILLLLMAVPAHAAVNSGRLDDLRAQFNEDRNNIRVVALLSPT
jgi:hypothetical protein